MGLSDQTSESWCLGSPRTLRGHDADLVYVVIWVDTDNPELQREVALVSARDLEGERYAHMIAAVPKLLAACQAVIERWEHGDLAEAARMCSEAVEMATEGKPCKTRRVEYYRLWGGDMAHGTWDTDYINIPADTPDDMIDKAIRKAAGKIEWRNDLPVIVGCYCNAGEEEDAADELPSVLIPSNLTPKDRNQAINDLLAKAGKSGLQAEDL